ncbi:MAG: hypothetical protein KAT77_02170 [Nanoarchaeota archaeon]|nr:hypothetical protein [Nanoarchaeota archaeon]
MSRKNKNPRGIFNVKNLFLTNKKGIVIGQVFIYIMAVVVFAVVLIFGYMAITDFLEKGEKVAYVIFKNDLENAVKNIYSDYGSVVVYNEQNPFPVPSKYEEVCFVDLDEAVPDDSFCDRKPLICDAWQTTYDAGGWEQGDQNVFLDPIGLGPIKVFKIRIDTDNDGEGRGLSDDDYLCLTVRQGRLFMRLEGKGDHALISRVT